MTMPKEWKPHNEIEEKSAEESEGKRKALIISVSDYNDNKLQPLEFCKNDGEKMYEILNSLGYEITNNHKLIGQVDYNTMRTTIHNFFRDQNAKPKDTLLFYFSGHGVPDGSGDTYLSTSEIDPDIPDANGYSFDELTKVIGKSISKRTIIILDCCYSGAIRIASKGNERDVAKTANKVILETIENKKTLNQELGEGRCILASSQAHQESVALRKVGYSLFTYYLLEGLNGAEGKSVDSEGRVTPNLLGDYIDDQIMSLPIDRRPNQRPIIKTENSGKIILAEHPQLAKKQIDVSWIIEQGKEYLKNEDYDTAIKFFDEAIAANPKTAVAHNYKGDALFKLEKYEESIKSYDQALKINPNYSEAWKDKGLSLDQLRKHEEAIQCFNTVLKMNPRNAEIWYYKGRSLFHLSKYDEAIESYDEALKINPNHADVLKEKVLALDNLRKQTIIHNKKSDDVSSDISFIYEGLQYFENDDYDTAIKFFDEAIAANPKTAVAHNYKGDALFKLEKYEQSIECYDKALSINPKYLHVLKDKGLTLERLGKYDEAIRCYDEALKINPNNADVLNDKGVTLSKLERYNEAIKYYDKAIDVDPNNINAWYNKGLALHYDLSKYDEAIGCYDKVMEIDPNYLNVRINKEDAVKPRGWKKFWQ